MKFYSLIKRKRLIKLNISNSYILLGATILIFGSFFYSQITFANAKSSIIPTNNIALYTKEDVPLKLNSASTQNVPLTVIQLSQLKKDLGIKSFSLQNKEQIILKNTITPILIDTPMEKMLEPISKQPRIVAAFLIGIALKESGLGKHAPTLNGQDCYNYYWGYRGKRAKMGTNGYTCFNSPEDAIETVGRRIYTLAIDQKRDTPQKMLIWKCGSNCETAGGQLAAQKWVKDISIYFNKINN